MNISEYKEFGWNNENSQPYHKLIVGPIESMLPNDGSYILDIGCGNGFLVNYLISKGYSVYGMDASELGVEIANKKNPGHFFVNDIVSGKLPEQLTEIQFKTIISTEVIEHLYSPQEYVRFVSDILKQSGGGLFIVSTPYYGYFKNILISVMGRMDYHFSALWEGGHIKFWSRKTLSRLLTDAGFKGIVFMGVGRSPYLWCHMIVSCYYAPQDVEKKIGK